MLQGIFSIHFLKTHGKSNLVSQIVPVSGFGFAMQLRISALVRQESGRNILRFAACNDPRGFYSKDAYKVKPENGPYGVVGHDVPCSVAYESRTR